MKLIIQIPAFNEEATIALTIRDLPKRIEGVQLIEILIIDDGSTDGTIAAARAAGAHHIVRLTNHRGLATAFLAGIDASLRLGADIIVNTDADHQYRGDDVAKLVAPIIRGTADVVVGDRDTQSSPHMSEFKKFLQRLGSWAVGRASGVTVPDVTSGFRAFSRDAAFQINVFNPFTYTLETIIQAGNRNLELQSVRVGTNPPTRPSRLYRGMFTYVRKAVVTIFRIYTVYKPLKTFFFIGAALFLLGLGIGFRFLYFFLTQESAGHLQSLILAAVLLIAGFQTILIGLVADLISVNRRLNEEVLIRVRKLQPISVPRQRGATRTRREPVKRGEQRPEAVGEPIEQETQWIWLIDESKVELSSEEAAATVVPLASDIQPAPAPVPRAGGAKRRRRRRRPGARQFNEPLEHHHHGEVAHDPADDTGPVSE